MSFKFQMHLVGYIPMTWCLVASMVALAISSDLKVAPLSVVSTVSFSFWPTHRAASCWRRSLTSEGEDRDNECLIKILIFVESTCNR